MRTWLAVAVAVVVFSGGVARPSAAQVVVTTVSPQQTRPGTPARDAQPEKTGTAIIKGHVVAADTGRPLRRAQVRLFSSEIRGGRLATTDAEGRYEFKELPTGRYTLSVSKGGYVGLEFGQRRPFESGKPIELRDAQVIDKADFALPRGSAIMGRVLDEFGEPVADAAVQALRYQFIAGQRRLMPTGRGGTTNDLGQYRIYGLPPGDYVVSATVRSMGSYMIEGQADEPTAYAATYYPGTANAADAQRLAVAVGQEANGIDFSLLSVRTAKIAGVVTDSEAKPAEGAMVMLMPRSLEGLGMRMGGGASRVAKDGTFTIANVAPGDYVLQVRTGNAGAMTLVGGGGMFITSAITEGATETPREPEFASVPVSIAGQDVTGLAIVTGKGGRVTGKVVFENGPAPPRESWRNLRVMPQTTDTEVFAMIGQGVEPVADDGSFEAKGVSGSVLMRPIGLPGGWMLKRVEYNGQDITDTPIEFKGQEEATGVEVVLTAQTTAVTGGVSDDRGQAVKDYTIVVFSEDSAKWGPRTRYVASARPDQDGRFQVKRLPPGDYLAVALDYVQQGEWADPTFLERIKSAGTAFSLAWGQTRTLELKVTEY